MINFYYIKKFKVTKKGKVTAVKAGKAKVTVTEKLKKKTRKIGVVMVKVKAKKAVEISQSENHTAAGGNPGGCLFLGGRLWSATRKSPLEPKGKSLLYGLKREIVVWIKRKVLVVWSEARKRRLDQRESPSCVV